MKTAAALAALLAVSASAQPDPSELAQASAAASELAKQAKEALAIQQTLTAMADGNAMGMQLVQFLQDIRGQISMHPSQEPVTVVFAGGRPMIFLSDSLPKYPRVLGPLIAKELAESMYYQQGLPRCAEVSYMTRGAAARVWVELGGTAADLPKIEPTTGAQVPAVLEIIKPWMQRNQETALEQIGKLDGTPSIMTKGDEVQEKAVNKVFSAFLMEEREIRAQAGLR